MKNYLNLKSHCSILSVLLGFLYAIPANAQQTTQVEGVVYEQNADTPVDFATVSLFPANLHTYTNAKGEFLFPVADAGKTNIKIQFVGFESIDTLVNVQAGQKNRFVFHLRNSDFRLKEVTVVATQSKAGLSTSSVISRQAIDHLQASTLTDLMQLLPGVAITNPNLNSANYVHIRGVDADNSLGTAIIMDGIQQSNNANLQVMSPAMNGATGGAGSGIDVRSISLDNIESVEVIRGIPSAEYGDLTTGALIIKSRTGKDPWRVKFKTNPDLYQGSLSKGLSLGEKGGNLNISGDYLYTVKNPTEAYAFYQRLAAKALWTSNLSKHLYSTMSFDLNYGRDTRTSNPNDQTIDLTEGSQDAGIAFGNTSILTVNRGWLKSVEWSAGAKYSNKDSWSRERLAQATGLYSTAMVDGAVVGNTPGQHLYDTDGNEITRLSGAENAFAAIMPNEYYSGWRLYGKEINVYAKVKANFNKRWGNINNRILTGVDLRADGNIGRGKIYDDVKLPPLRSTSGYRAQRERPYKDIPFISQLGIFAENHYLHSFGERDLKIIAGVRFDYVNRKSVTAPRFNASFDLLPESLILRGGYGLTAKAPTLVYLYPQNAYFDFRLTQTIPSDNPLFLCETRTFESGNPDLEIAVNRKAEIGLDVKIRKKYRLSLTAFDELKENGYGFSTTLNTIRLTPYRQYVPVPVDGNQVLSLAKASNVFVSYSEPTNNLYSHNRGVEFELDLGRFDVIRTAFYLNGAYNRVSTKDKGYSFSMLANGNNLERNIGVYAPGRISSESEFLLGALRITHNIPSIGFVVTFTSQLRLMNNNWMLYGSDVFEKYLSYRDGKVYDFDPALRDDPEFNYLFPGINNKRDLMEKEITTLFFNINISKEIGNYFTASFFANNMFNSHFKYESTVTPGSFRELGENLFFGFDLKIIVH
ncbi:MAG: TonB-dependent receptor [Dysgonamonadaceae bacterium]|jgi:hypothetical protein|nr:TonB-dependent receptor [Dysgonamonadaceae bacterium]